MIWRLHNCFICAECCSSAIKNMPSITDGRSANFFLSGKLFRRMAAMSGDKHPAPVPVFLRTVIRYLPGENNIRKFPTCNHFSYNTLYFICFLVYPCNNAGTDVCACIFKLQSIRSFIRHHADFTLQLSCKSGYDH